MCILIVAATPQEVEPLQQWLNQTYKFDAEKRRWTVGSLTVSMLITGVGIVSTVYQVSRRLEREQFDLVINVGVAGSFRNDLPPGTFVQLCSDQFADFGVEEADGSFVSAFELGLCDPNEYPFQDGKLWHPHAAELFFKDAVHGLTVQRVHGEARQIELARTQYQADIETMEGAAFFYVCLQARVSFLAFRAISNFVEPRNRANWKMKEAIDELDAKMRLMLASLQ